MTVPALSLLLALALLLLSPPAVIADSYSSVPSISIPSIPGPGLDRDCLRRQKSDSDAEAARRVHQCTKPYQPGPYGDARLKPQHPAANDAKPANTDSAGKTKP